MYFGGANYLQFDNLPMFSTTDNSTTAHPPVFNPFEHFWWGDCWTYAPPPNEKYLPQEGVHLANCIPNNNNTVIGSPNAGLLPANGFGAGPRESINAYWFDAHSTFVACDDTPFDLNGTCQFSVTAWKWDGTTEIVLSTDVYTLPSCRSGVNCRLHQIPFPLTYTGLTSLNFSATIDDEPRSFYMDTIHLDWFNNSCEAGLMRISSRKVRLV
jgi:hypothetical protein